MSLRSGSVGKLVARFEGAERPRAVSEPKSHPLAFAFARWWRVVQVEVRREDGGKAVRGAPDEGIGPPPPLHFEGKDGKVSPALLGIPKEKAESQVSRLSGSTGTPEGTPEGSTSSGEALIFAARAFLAQRAPGTAGAASFRLDESDTEEEGQGARDVLAAAKMLAKEQQLSDSLDAFASLASELWTSPPRRSRHSENTTLLLSETARENEACLGCQEALAQLQVTQEVVKEQSQLLQLERLQRDELELKLQELQAAQSSYECNEVEALAFELEELKHESSEAEAQCRQLAEEKQTLADALAARDAAPVSLPEPSDDTARALETAAAAVAELRRRLGESEAQRRLLQQRYAKLELDSAQELSRLRHVELQEQQIWVLQRSQGAQAAEETVDLPNEVLSAADLAAHLTGGVRPVEAQADKACAALSRRVLKLQSERDAMAVEVRETLALLSTSARQHKELRRALRSERRPPFLNR